MPATTAPKVISITPVRTSELDAIEQMHERLEGAGYLRMMQIGEPRLSELVGKYKSKGYEVEVVPYVDDGEDGTTLPSVGCGPGSCSSGSSAGGCSSGGCASGAGGAAPVRRNDKRTIVPGVGTIYVRLST